MTVAPLGAETPVDLDCTRKGQHMTGNQSAPNWMISSHLNMFQLFFSFLPHHEKILNMRAFFFLLDPTLMLIISVPCVVWHFPRQHQAETQQLAEHLKSNIDVLQTFYKPMRLPNF